MISEKLGDNEILENLDQLADLIIEQDLITVSKRLIITINKLFKQNHLFFKNNPSLQRRYEYYLTRAKLVTLFDFDEDEILKLIDDNLADILSFDDYDLYEKIRQKMTTIYDLEARDKFKGRIKEQLLVNSGVITSAKIRVNDLEKRPTIGNWIKDYYSKTGLESVDSLTRNQYLINDVNTRQLSSQERDKLKKLINFFEKLKLSSDNFENLEEKITIILPNKEVAILSQGEIEKASPDVMKTYREIMALEKPISPETEVADKKIEDVITPLKQRIIVNENKPEVDDSPRLSRIEYLEGIIKNYPTTSLEYRAIQQELNKLNRKG